VYIPESFLAYGKKFTHVILRAKNKKIKKYFDEKARRKAQIIINLGKTVLPKLRNFVRIIL
jgi:hypothetical protein